MKSLAKLTFICLFLISGFTSIHAQNTAKISIQGTLKDANGAAVDDGTYSVEFRLYDVETGGTIKWSETATVESSGGIYSHYLGSIVPLDATVFDQTLFLGIKIGAYELIPRTELTYAPYTFASNTALSAVKVICSGAVGDVKYSILNPTQFALENGDCWVPMNGGSMFGTKLATILQTNTLPDASGVFFRAHEYIDGRDSGRSPSSPIANIEADEIESHTHGHSLSFSGTTTTNGSHSHNMRIGHRGFDSDGSSVGLEDNQTTGSFNPTTTSDGAHSHSISGAVSGSISNFGAGETRPINMNLYVYIRVN